MKRMTIIIPTLLLGISVAGITFPQAFAQTTQHQVHQKYSSSNTSNSSSWGNNGVGGMMGYGNGYGGMMSGFFGGSGGSQANWVNSMISAMNQYNGTAQTMKAADASAAVTASLQNATVDQANNTITYTGKTLKIVALGGAMDNSKSGPAEKFIIGGLTNPTLQIPKGAKVTLELINEDTDMPHGIEVTNAQPPYGYMSMMQGGIYPGSFIPPIPEAGSNSYPVASSTFIANQTGTYYYFCEYPGHAAEGMYGQIVVK